MAETKTLQLKIVTDTANAVTALNKINDALVGTDVSLTGLKTGMKTAEGGVTTYTQHIQLASKSLDAFKIAQERVQKALGQGLGGDTAQSNILKEISIGIKKREKDQQDLNKSIVSLEREVSKDLAEIQKQRATTASGIIQEQVARAKSSIAETVAINKEGVDSITALKIRAAERERQLQVKLQEDLKTLQARYESGSINKGAFQGASAAIIASYRQRVVSVRSSVEEEQTLLQGKTSVELRLQQQAYDDWKAKLDSRRSKRQLEVETDIQLMQHDFEVWKQLNVAKVAAQANTQARRGAYADVTTNEQLAQTRAAINSELAIQQYGANSKEAIRARSAEKQRQIESKLQIDLETINRKFTSGTLSITDHATERTRLLANYKSEMMGLPSIVDKVAAAHKSLARVIGETLLAWTAIHRMKSLISSVVGSFAGVGIELDSTKASLTATMGSAAGMAASLVALDKEAERTGITIGVLRENFRNFQASTSLAGISLESTWNMFTKLNSVMTGLHLTTDKAKGVFTAISQIFNKSKVQSEELVKQLGNLLPGAFASFAASMGVGTEELSKRMKAGTVYAKDTMEQFINYMYTRFLPAFEAAQDGLNANWGRFGSAVTKLKESFYEANQGMMNEVVKTATSWVNAMTSMVDGTAEVNSGIAIMGKAVKDLAITGIALLVAKVVKLIATWATMEAAAITSAARMSAAFAGTTTAVEATTAASVLLRTGLTVLSKIGFVAVIAGIVEIGSRLLEAATAAKSARESISNLIDKEDERRAKNLKERTAIGAVEVKVADDPLVKELKKSIAQHEANQATLSKDKVGRGQVTDPESVKKLIASDNELILLRGELIAAEFQAREGILGEIEKGKQEAHEALMGSMQSQIDDNVLMGARAARSLEDALKVEGSKIQAAVDKATNTAATAKSNLKKLLDEKASKEDITRANEAVARAELLITTTEEAKGKRLQKVRDEWAKKGESASSKASTAALRQTKADIAIDGEYIKTIEEQAKTKLANLDRDNTSNIISYERFFAAKQAIYDKAYQDEVKYYEDQKALAQKSGDKQLVTKATQELERLKARHEADTATVEGDKASKVNDLNTELANIHDKYQDIIGAERDSVEINTKKLDLLRKQLQAEAAMGGESGAKAARGLQELESYEKISAVQKQFKVHHEAATRAEKVFNSEIERTRVLKDAGVVSELQAAIANTQANKRHIKTIEDEIKANEGLLESNNLNITERETLTDKINSSREALENFKVTSNEVATLFEGKLSSAFESSFTGVITGSMSAGEAFKSFGRSVLQTIAEMIAAEARSAILKPLFSMAFSGIAGMFGGAETSVAAGNSESFVSTMNSPNFWTKSAKGNVFAANQAGISSYSGTIVDKPTLFPFAKGTGLMGEAGAEAILPLKRNSQGKLGVSLENGGQAANSNIYYINTTVNTSSNSSADEIGGKVAQQVMRAIAKQEINSASRRGNQLNPITKYG